MANNPSNTTNEQQVSESSHTTLTASAAVAAVAASPDSVSTTLKIGTGNPLHGDGVLPLDDLSKTRTTAMTTAIGIRQRTPKMTKP